MTYKIGTLTVQVQPGDESFEDQLRAQVKAATDNVDAQVGLRLDNDATISLNEDVLAAIDLATENAKAHVGLGLKDDAVAELDADVQAGVDLVEERAKVKVTIDPKSAADTQEGLSGLIVAGIVGGAAIGAPALVAGVDAAFTAITAKALANNQVIKADYASLAADAGTALQQAVAPLAPGLHQAVEQVDAEIGKLQPTLDGLFANAQPDLAAFATGVDGLAAGVLPGLSKALGNSHDLVSDVAAGMGQLGTGVGDFLAGLTRDESTTGQGLEAVIGTASNALGTLGNIAGSASSAISTDLLAITPAVNGALDAIDKLSNPATVGAAAGGFAAFKLGGSIESGLDSVSNKLLDVAANTESAGGFLGKMSGAAASSSMGLSKMASVMGGPWGIAIGAGVGLLSGLVGELINAGDATKAVTLNAGDLAKAVAQDGGAAGQATAAYIAAASGANGMSDAVGKAGVSQATWTEAVLGNGQATNTVIESVNKLNQAQRNSGITAAENASDTGKFSDAQQASAVAAAKNAAAHNILTDANQKTINTLRAEQKQVADSIAAQTKYEQAIAKVTNTEQLFDASLQAAYNQLVANAQAAALTTVGTLNLGNANYSATSAMDAIVTSYTEAAAQGNAYAQVLQALTGNTANLLTSEAAFTTALSGVSAAAKANGTSLDINTAKGAANITAFTGVASAANKAAAAVEQNETSTKGSIIAYQDANTKLEQEKQAFEDAAIKAGYNKQQVEALADELFKLPPSISISADVSKAEQGLNTLLKKIDSAHGYVDVSVMSDGTIGNLKGARMSANAQGGRGYAGVPQIVGDGGRPEVFVPDSNGYTYPSIQAGAKAVAEHNARVGAPATGVTVNQYFTGPNYPNGEQRAQMMHSLAATLGAF